MSVSDLIRKCAIVNLGADEFNAFPVYHVPRVSHVGIEKGIIFLSVEYAAILSIEYEAFLKIGTNMSESFEWHSFLESVEDLCRQVEHRIQLSD